MSESDSLDSVSIDSYAWEPIEAHPGSDAYRIAGADIPSDPETTDDLFQEMEDSGIFSETENAEEYPPLGNNVIKKILAGDKPSMPLVQILNIHKVDTCVENLSRFMVSISDGSSVCTDCPLATRLYEKAQSDNLKANTVVQLSMYMVDMKTPKRFRKIFIADYKVELKAPDVIGSPRIIPTMQYSWDCDQEFIDDECYDKNSCPPSPQTESTRSTDSSEKRCQSSASSEVSEETTGIFASLKVSKDGTVITFRTNDWQVWHRAFEAIGATGERTANRILCRIDRMVISLYWNGTVTIQGRDAQIWFRRYYKVLKTHVNMLRESGAVYELAEDVQPPLPQRPSKFSSREDSRCASVSTHSSSRSPRGRNNRRSDAVSRLPGVTFFRKGRGLRFYVQDIQAWIEAFSTLLPDQQQPRRLSDRTLVHVVEESTTVCLHDDGKVVIHHTHDAGDWLRARYARLKALVDSGKQPRDQSEPAMKGHDSPQEETFLLPTLRKVSDEREIKFYVRNKEMWISAFLSLPLSSKIVERDVVKINGPAEVRLFPNGTVTVHHKVDAADWLRGVYPIMKQNLRSLGYRVDGLAAQPKPDVNGNYVQQASSLEGAALYMAACVYVRLFSAKPDVNGNYVQQASSLKGAALYMAPCVYVRLFSAKPDVNGNYVQQASSLEGAALYMAPCVYVRLFSAKPDVNGNYVQQASSLEGAALYMAPCVYVRLFSAKPDVNGNYVQQASSLEGAALYMAPCVYVRLFSAKPDVNGNYVQQASSLEGAALYMAPCVYVRLFSAKPDVNGNYVQQASSLEGAALYMAPCVYVRLFSAKPDVNGNYVQQASSLEGAALYMAPCVYVRLFSAKPDVNGNYVQQASSLEGAALYMAPCVYVPVYWQQSGLSYWNNNHEE